MLKLKYLFDNPELAKVLVNYWEHDAESLELFQYFRISSNAIYPFRSKGNIHLLRFAPIEEKDIDCVAAELDFIDYLKGYGIPVLEAVPSKKGKYLEQVETPWGTYLSSVFKRVDGQQLGELPLTLKMCRLQGISLANLHMASADYKPKHTCRKSYLDCLENMATMLQGKPQEALARAELHLLSKAFDLLEKDNDSYGLIHYDFELDNLFYDKNQQKMSIIDFDDAMYHWYAQDVYLALRSIHEESETVDTDALESAFVTGYESVRTMPAAYASHRELFERFANLYKYCRILKATEERCLEEPEWMVELRNHLSKLKARASMYFGRELME